MLASHRRDRNRQKARSSADAVSGPDAAPPYATLADQSLGPLDGDPVAGPTDMIETPEPTDDAEPTLDPEPEPEPAPAETEPPPAETEPPPADRGDAP